MPPGNPSPKLDGNALGVLVALGLPRQRMARQLRSDQAYSTAAGSARPANSIADG